MDWIRAKLAEYDALKGEDPDDPEGTLISQAIWTASNPAPVVMRKCFYCRRPMTPIQLQWDWVRAEVAAGREIEQATVATCDGCRGEDGDAR